MIVQVPTKKPRLGAEVTGAQTISYTIGYDGELSRDLAKLGTYADYRELRKDATIALGRGLLVSGVLAGAWSVEADENVDEKAIASVTSLLPFREQLIQTAVAFARVDFGWQGYEKTFAVGPEGRVVLEKLKPLLHDISCILVDEKGNFRGYRQTNMITSIRVDIPAEKCLHVAFDVEGGNLYGIPLLENIRTIQAMWNECNDGAKRYDKKMAGSHFVVHYPPGTSEIDGEAVDNSVVAKRLLAALESSGSMAMPSTTAEVLQELTNDTVSKLYQWDVTLLSDLAPRQGTFIDRLKYLDSLKLRGLLLPERACTEGQYGTKAESETHLGLVITELQEIDKAIIRQVNEQLVSQLLLLNWGEEMVGKVRLAVAPLVDKQISYLRKLYLKVLEDPGALVREIGGIDVDALKEKLGIPVKAREGD